MSDQAEILISRALSPAKPVQLFIDDEKKYCVALFEDENLDSAIGRNGTNINLASQVTKYRIDAYGVKQYERIQDDHKTPLSEIEGVSEKVSTALTEIGVKNVSDLLDADMEIMLDVPGLDEELLDLTYGSVQAFVEREIEIKDDENEILDLFTHESGQNEKLDSKNTIVATDSKNIVNTKNEKSDDKDNIDSIDKINSDNELKKIQQTKSSEKEEPA